MPTFMDSLANNPSNGVGNPTGGSNIYGQPQKQNPQELLGIVNALKNREMQDFQDKANFMSNLSLKQDRLRALYDPNKQSSQGQQQQDPNKDPNTGMQNMQNLQKSMNPPDPNAISPSQKADLAMKQQQLDQQGKLGQENIDNKTKQEALNQQKSDQIHAQKIAELEAKQTEAKGKLDLANQQLTSKNSNLQDQLTLHKTIADNTKIYHDAQMASQQLKFDKAASDHKDTMAAMQKKLDAANKTTKTTMSADGTSKTTQVTTGSPGKTIQVQGKDGNTYEIPADKQDEWNQQHAPETTGQPPAAMAGPQSGADDEESDQ